MTNINTLKVNFSNHLLPVLATLHFAILLTVAALFAFGYSDTAKNWADANMLLVGFYWLFEMHKKAKLISTISFICIALAILVVQLINYNYNVMLYVNIEILILYVIFLIWQKDKSNLQIIALIFALPILFSLLNIVSTKTFGFDSFARNLWDAGYLAAGLWLIAKNESAFLQNHMTKIASLVLLVYTILLVQLPIASSVHLKSISIMGLNLTDLTLANTAHICIYTAAVFLLAIYLFVTANILSKMIYLPIVASLFLFILFTSWRPIWLGLILGLVIAVLLCYKKSRALTLTGLLLLLLVLLATNLGNFRDRMTSLVTQNSTEERHIIWQDAWQMQLTSQPLQWLIGHGLMQFKNDFKQYSRFNNRPETIKLPETILKRKWVFGEQFNNFFGSFKIHAMLPKPKNANSEEKLNSKYFSQKISFQSPHNLLLDILYTSGVFGIVLVGCFYALIIRYMTKLAIKHTEHCLAISLLIAALISNMVVNGLNFPFFYHLNLVPLGFICGLLLMIREKIYALKANIHAAYRAG